MSLVLQSNDPPLFQTHRAAIAYLYRLVQRGSHSPRLGLYLLFPVQALQFLHLRDVLADRDLRPSSIQRVQVNPRLLRNLPIISS